MVIVAVSYRISNSCGFLTNEQGEPTSTLFCVINVSYHSELRVAITFY